MNNNIDQLKTEVDNIKNSLNELKDNVSLSEVEKKNQAEALKAQAETTKQKIQAEINALDTQTGADIDKEKAEAQALLHSCNEIVNLYASIINPGTIEITPTTPIVSATPTTPTASTEEKGFFGKAGDWLGEQWNKAKENPGKYILCATGLVAGRWAIKKAWNWAFGDDDENKSEENEDEETESKSKKKKKSFWKSGWGKFLKWAGIGTVGAGIGWWLGKKLGLIHSDDLTDRAENQAENTVKLKETDPKKFEKYKGMGENIDSQYDQVMKKEIDAGWGGMSIADGYNKYADKNNIDKDTFQATVPMCIDNEFSDVSHFLSEGGYYAYLRGLNFNELKNEIIKWGKEKIGKVLGPYLTGLTSFIPFVGKDRSEAITNWFESGDAAEREAELQLFFRQYAKVLNYTQDKLFSLKEKIAEEKILHTEGNHSTASDALKDGEWVENYINTDPRYKNFVNGKLHQAVDVMKDNNIFNDSLSHDMEKIKSSCDAERDTILNFKEGKDCVQRLEAAGTNLTTEHYREGVECCDKITKDIEEEFDKSFHYLYFSSVHEAINSKENNIQEFMKHSGLADLKSGLKVSISEFKQKFASGNITQEEIQLYKNQVNSYFAMKKEIFIGARAIQQMKSDNPNFVERVLNIGCAVVKDLLNQTGAALKHLKDGEFFSAWVSATIPLYLGGKALSLAGNKYPAAKRFGQFMKNSNIIAVARRSKGAVMRRIYAENLNNMPILLLKARYNIAHGDQLLLQDLIEGKIRGDTATKIIENGNGSWLKISGNNKASSISEFVQKMFGKNEVVMPAKYIDILFNNKADIVFMRNSNLRKMFFGEPSISWIENGKSILNGYRKKLYNPSDFSKVEVLEDFMLSKGGNSSIFETLSAEQKIFAKQMIETGNFKSIEEVKSLTANIKKYNLNGFDDIKISHLVEELVDHTDEFSDIVKIEERIKKVTTATTEVVETAARRAFNASIDKAIAKLNEVANPSAVAHHIKQLEALKKDATLVDDEMECFVKFIDEGFDAKLIPELKKLINITDTFREGEKIGDELKKLLSTGKYEEFKSILRQPDLANIFNKIKVDDVLKNFDKVLLKGGSAFGVETAKLLKSFFKVLAKVL